jgi:hypothetical protein
LISESRINGEQISGEAMCYRIDDCLASADAFCEDRKVIITNASREPEVTMVTRPYWNGTLKEWRNMYEERFLVRFICDY